MRCRFHFSSELPEHLGAMAWATRYATLAALLGALGCQHVPSEESLPSAAPAVRSSPPIAALPSRNATSSSASSSDEPPFDGRCVLPTPDIAPPAVPPGPAAACPPDPEGEPRALPLVHLGFSGPGAPELDAELVRSPHDTARGLMYRKSLPEDRGMLFDLRVREDHQFWMHNTCVPLDLIFIDFDGLVVGVVENAPTLDDSSRGVRCPSRWVLEVNAGWSRRHGVRAGHRIELPDAARAPR